MLIRNSATASIVIIQISTIAVEKNRADAILFPHPPGP